MYRRINTCNHRHLFKPEYYDEGTTRVHAPTSDEPFLYYPALDGSRTLAITTTYLNLNITMKVLQGSMRQPVMSHFSNEPSMD